MWYFCLSLLCTSHCSDHNLINRYTYCTYSCWCPFYLFWVCKSVWLLVVCFSFLVVRHITQILNAAISHFVFVMVIILLAIVESCLYLNIVILISCLWFLLLNIIVDGLASFLYREFGEKTLEKNRLTVWKTSRINRYYQVLNS